MADAPAFPGHNRGVRIAILGLLEVHDDGGAAVPVAGARLRGLIARLALAGGQPVSTGALAEAVWDYAPPADVANALQTLVSRARRTLGGAGAVEQSAAGYRLAVRPDDVDALRFERLVAEGAVAEALGLWRGPALADAGEFAEPFARRLEELRFEATVTLLTREIEAGRSAARAGELEALVAEHPLHEKLTGLLMRALVAAGRQADALAAYEALRTRLADELGIDPGPQLQAVHLEVLRGEIAAAHAAAVPARSNLRAQLTSFVGRTAEVARVRAALESYRLVTLVGPGGAGKTRLAAEVAAGVRDTAARNPGQPAPRTAASRTVTWPEESGWPSSRRSPMRPTCRRRYSARSACANRACCRTARSGSPAATREPGCLRASPTPAPCSSSTTASTSSTRAPTWRTRCSRTARGCGS